MWYYTLIRTEYEWHFNFVYRRKVSWIKHVSYNQWHICCSFSFFNDYFTVTWHAVGFHLYWPINASAVSELWIQIRRNNIKTGHNHCCHNSDLNPDSKIRFGLWIWLFRIPKSVFSEPKYWGIRKANSIMSPQVARFCQTSPICINCTGCLLCNVSCVINLVCLILRYVCLSIKRNS